MRKETRGIFDVEWRWMNKKERRTEERAKTARLNDVTLYIAKVLLSLTTLWRYKKTSNLHLVLRSLAKSQLGHLHTIPGGSVQLPLDTGRTPSAGVPADLSQ